MLELYDGFGPGPTKAIIDQRTELTPEYKVLKGVIEATWRDLHYGDVDDKVSAQKFIDNGLDWLIEPTDLDLCSIKRMLKKPPPRKNHGNGGLSGGRVEQKITWDGMELTFKEWGKLKGLRTQTIRDRYRKWGACEKTFSPDRASRKN